MGLMLTGCNQKNENNQNEEGMNTTLTLTQEWDKTFPKSDKVDHKKVTFKNRYGIELAADMYTPKNAEGKLAALAVYGPFGAVKEQTSGTTAQRHIQDAVIERSKQLLVETRLPVSEIAYQLGFEYPQHFSRLFKQVTKKTPLQYKEDFAREFSS